MKKKILILIIFILAGLAIYYYIQIKQGKKETGVLTIYGNVDIREVNLSFRIPGLIKIMKLEEGELAKKGKVIAYIDENQYIDQLNEANSQVNMQMAELDKLLAGTRYEEIAQAKALLQEREATLLNTEQLLDKNKQGYEAGVVSQQEYDNSAKQRDEASARLSSAKEALLESLNGPRIEDINAARASLKAAQAKSSSLQKTISYTTLFAPSDGVILTRIKEPGAYVNAGEPVYTLAINSPKWVQTYVDEADLGKIRSGMKAQITSDSYTNKTYSGYIGFISPIAEFTPKSVETPELRASLVYRLRLIVKDSENQLRQGMPVTVKIKIGSNKNDKTDNKNK